jgi:ketol-acid reductoisomerase
LIIVGLPDEQQQEIYTRDIKPYLTKGKTFGATHGLNVHFKLIDLPKDVDIVMIAPKGPGHLVRSEFVKGGGVPCLVAVHQDATGNALKTALAWGHGIGGARAGIIQTTFKDECETDLFGEQTVLCGGMNALVTAAFETLTAAGYSPEIAYLECVHQLKFLADLLHDRGITGLRQGISSTALYGDVSRGSRVIGAASRAAMEQALAEIRSGAFARELAAEVAADRPVTRQEVARGAAHPIEAARRRALGLEPAAE